MWKSKATKIWFCANWHLSQFSALELWLSSLPFSSSLWVLPGVFCGWMSESWPTCVCVRCSSTHWYPWPSSTDCPTRHGGSEGTQWWAGCTLCEWGYPQRSYLRTIWREALQSGQVCRILLLAGEYLGCVLYKRSLEASKYLNFFAKKRSYKAELFLLTAV